MNQSEIQARLSIYRYAIVAVVITAFTTSFFTPVVFTSNPNYVDNGLSYGDVFVPALFIAFAAALIGMMSYVICAQVLKSKLEKSSFVIG